MAAPRFKAPAAKYPTIDIDPHFSRVVGYARPVDWAITAACTAAGPALMAVMNELSPVRARINRPVFFLSSTLGLFGGFLLAYKRSSLRFWGWTENAREQEMDMREMTQRILDGKPLYGTSELSPHMQGVAARNSRYSVLMFTTIPWFNFVNHTEHGVDTAKYYQNAAAQKEAAAPSS
ncbi:NADH-ubiquinone oxidoreductase 20 subunit [Neolecta irregularis DAH-3]|uniref:NADH-ubiquinone oxidoreductase 20 subunit n=1 Tax=Neolecta irregularis (strain DAH-3) TaxID=1198029 RepID=A0A1U7LIB2_NEOID|nr:NADH-ubiquinone oxidoreductase 20 subunit [Neolecta irregularis DAH-3]|eukprot:OLL22400.1 NADH-ubiquinone oxidoreductase 20 subunit [Neolecta irregularis DAH-3]